MNMIQQQQQQHVTGKRVTEQSENGCQEKKKGKAEVGTHSHTKTQEDQPCCIQSVVRRDRKVRLGENGGNLLKAESGGESGEESEDESEEVSWRKINVDFTGTDPFDSATEFHLEKSDDKQANALRYRLGEDNYYLAVKYTEVNLRKLVNFPTTNKYFFHIKRVGPEIESPFTLKSLKTRQYLHCGDNGKAFMEEAETIGNAEPEDRQTWFSYKLPDCNAQFNIQFKEEDMLFAKNESCIKCETDMEKFEDTEDSGKGNSKEPEKAESEESGKGTSKEPVEETSEDSGGGICKELEKGTSEDSGKAENSKEPEAGDSNEPEKDNSNDSGREITENQGEGTPEDLKKRSSEDSDPSNGNSEDAGKNNFE